jgi:DNA mismatch endonuclease Vsr
MRRVKSKNTKPELTLRHALWAAGVRGWRCHVRAVFGTPDLAWPGRKVAIFVDSAWWHGHPSRWTPGYHPRRWDEKIEQNRRRDLEVNRRLEREGWSVVRLWDFEIERDVESCIERVTAVVGREKPLRNAS